MMVSVASAWRLSLRVFVMTSIVGLSTGVLRSRKRSFVTQQQFLRSLSSRTVEYERVLSAKSFNTRRYPFYSQYKQFWSIRGGAEHSDQATIDISLSRKPFAGTIYPVSVCSIRGLRDHMEDDFVVASDFAAVFDGHGGDAVSKYLRYVCCVRVLHVRCSSRQECMPYRFQYGLMPHSVRILFSFSSLSVSLQTKFVCFHSSMLTICGWDNFFYWKRFFCITGREYGSESA